MKSLTGDKLFHYSPRGKIGITYGKLMSTNNLISFSIFMKDENDESFKKEVKIREGVLEYVTEGIECQLNKVTIGIAQILLHALDNKVLNCSGTCNTG